MKLKQAKSGKPTEIKYGENNGIKWVAIYVGGVRRVSQTLQHETSMVMYWNEVGWEHF